MSDEDDIAKTVLTHGGWLATVVIATGLWVLKKLFSSQLSILIEEFKQLREDVADLREDMSGIKAIIRERSNGHYTWPGDRR